MLVEQLSAFKAEGMSASAAAAALVGAGSRSRETRSAAGTEGKAPFETAAARTRIGASDLSLALAATFEGGLSPAELARIIHEQYPNLAAVEVARAVQAGLPSTFKADMYAALTGCGFSAGDAQAAVDTLYPAPPAPTPIPPVPVNVTVQANQPWQASGVTLFSGQKAAIVVSGGSWTANPQTGMCGAGGSGYVAKPGYTLPGAREGALIGRVGSNPPFLVGPAANAPDGQTGMLSLCINDDIERRYGSGLSDNRGALNVTVTLTGPASF
jgi:hypothetical protein